MRKIRVLLLIPNLGTGGAQKVYRQQLAMLAGDFEVMGCVFNRDGFLPEDHHANLYSLDVTGGANVVSKIIFFFRRISRLKKLKRQLSIDVCISHLEGADYINVFSRGKDRVMAWIHGTKTFDQNITGWLGWLRKKILIPYAYGRFDFLAAVNSRIREELVQEYGVPESKVRTIYNSFDLNAIRTHSGQMPDSALAELMTGKVIITHCRLAREKNLFALLELFAIVRESTDVRLVILGDGDLRNDLVKKSCDLNLATFDVWGTGTVAGTPAVCFLGYQANPYPFLSRASLYLMTSLWEGFPLALCEAMACGLPVISSDCYNGPREILFPEHEKPIPTTVILQGQYGILLPMITTDNHLQLRECSREVLKLLSDEALRGRYSRLSLQRVSEFDSQNIFRQISELIKHIDSDEKVKGP
jgi:glycosyltransferase involved in cell wall biosynthesis